MISAVAELYKLHPQTLRLYERVGLLKPSRSQGNTRLYTDADLERLDVIWSARWGSSRKWCNRNCRAWHTCKRKRRGMRSCGRRHRHRRG